VDQKTGQTSSNGGENVEESQETIGCGAKVERRPSQFHADKSFSPEITC
jgi:hypothetical protein